MFFCAVFSNILDWAFVLYKTANQTSSAADIFYQKYPMNIESFLRIVSACIICILSPGSFFEYTFYGSDQHCLQ